MGKASVNKRESVLFCFWENYGLFFLQQRENKNIKNLKSACNLWILVLNYNANAL